MIQAHFSRLLRATCLTVAIVLTAPFSGGEGLEPKRAAVELLLPGEPGFHYAGYYWAQWRGLFEEEGITVELRTQSRETMISAVLQGPGVYAVGGVEFLLARLQGRPVVMIAGVMQETEQALVTREGASWLPEDLLGRRIGLLPPPRSAPLRVMLLRAGAGSEQATWVTLDPTEGGALDAWQVDVRQADRAVLRPADYGVSMFYGQSLFAAETELAYYPERVRAVRRAVLRGWEQVLKNASTAIAALDANREVIGLQQSTAQLAREAEVVRGLTKPSMVPIGSIEPARVREMAEALVELGWVAHTDYLPNFVYTPPQPWLPRWVYWTGGALGAASLGGLVVLLISLQLQRRVRERTEALRRSEERARRMFENAPVAIVEEDFTRVGEWMAELRAEGVADLEAWLDEHPEAVLEQFRRVRVVEANPLALRSVGATDLAGYEKYLAEESNPDVLAAFRAELLTIWRGEQALTVEISFTGANGKIGYGLLQWYTPVNAGGTDLSRVLLVMTEITALREAEARVRESEASFRTLFESAVEGVYESTPEEGITVANPAFARMLGCASPAELLAWCRRVGTDQVYVDAHRRRQFLAEIERLDAIQDFESEVHGADGTRRWITENVRVIRDGEGRIVRLQGFVTDVSERKRFEHVLAEERERLAVTLGAMTEGVITTDRAGVVQFINEAAELMTGWSSGSAVGHRLADVCTLRHERTKADVPLPFDVAMTNAAPVDLPRSVQIVDRHGTARLVEGRCAPIHNFHSRPVGVVLVLRDTGERSRLEAERLRTSKLESLGVLAGGIAHDFNNLLTVVLGNVSLAQLDRGVARAAGRWLKDAEIAAVRARELTQQLLTFARGGDPVRTAVRVPEVVREAAEFALHGSSVRCEYHLPPDLWPADIDRGQIGQVVQNLVINGVQAMPDGGVIRISIANVKHPGDPVGTIAPGTYLRLEIADEGGGIRSENLSRIFDPYFTTKATGSGLGLAMVYSIIKKHEGHIEVDSEVGRGTTFKIHLPAVPTAQPVPTTPEAAPERMSGRVLFMDDEESIRRMATALLERLGLSVTVVDDGRALLHEYRNAQQIGRPYDVVLMDLTVPGGMGGREAMEALRRIDPEVKAVVSSGYSSDPVLANYRAHGFRGRVAKPYRATDLARTLQEVLTTSSDLTGVREVRSTVA